MRLFRMLAALGFLLGAARAFALPPETIVDALPDATPPALAIDPATGEPHVAYVNNDTLYYAWRSGGVWQLEPVASDAIGGPFATGGELDLKIAPDGRIYVLYLQSQTASVVFAERKPGGWDTTVLDTPALGFTYGSLAVSPVTGEPVAAWASRPASVLALEVKVARRSGGSWTTQVVDTTTAPFRMVAVAVDAADRPRVAWGRWRADNAPAIVLTCALASGPSGPYAAAPVDSEFARSENSYFSMALDPATGEPRIAYAGRSVSGQYSIRYASHDAGAWGVMTVETRTNSNFPPPSLAIDPANDPYVATTEYAPIAPEGLRGGDAGGCIFVSTGHVELFHRHGSAGLGLFTVFASLSSGGDNANGPRSLAAPIAGVAATAWRNPGMNCAPFLLSYSLATPLAGVEPGPGLRVALGPVAPNPARLGASFSTSFELARAAEVSLELHDVAGRLVAGHVLGSLDAGPHAFAWAPAAPQAGLYWLTLRADGVRLATRAVVIAR